MLYAEDFLEKEKVDNVSFDVKSNDYYGVEDIVEYSDLPNLSSKIEGEFGGGLDLPEESLFTIDEKNNSSQPSSITTEDTAQLKKIIQQAFLDKLPQLMEYKQKGYNLQLPDKEGMALLEKLLQEMRTQQYAPDALKATIHNTLSSSQDFLDNLKVALKKEVTSSDKFQEAIQQANAVIRHICVALKTLQDASKIYGVTWEAEVDRVNREQGTGLVAASLENLQQYMALPLSDAEILMRKNELSRLLFAEETELQAENAQFKQLRNSLLAESRITRQRLTKHLSIKSAEIVAGARDGKEYAMTSLHRQVNPATLGNAVLRGHGTRDLSLYTRHIVAIDGAMKSNISVGNPLMGTFINQTSDEPAHTCIARAILPVVEMLGAVAVALEKVGVRVQPVAEDIKQNESLGQEIWADMKKKNAETIASVPYLLKQGKNKFSTISNVAKRNITAKLPGATATASDVNRIVRKIALLLLDEIQQIEARIKQLPLQAEEIQEAVEQYNSLKREIHYGKTSPELSTLLDEALTQEARRWQTIKQTAQIRLQKVMVPISRFAGERGGDDFQVMLRKMLIAETLKLKSSHDDYKEQLGHFNREVIRTVEQLKKIACNLDDVMELATQGHGSSDKLNKKVTQAIMDLRVAKGGVKAAVMATGTALHNFSRDGMLARGMAEWAEEVKQRYLQEKRPEHQAAAAELFEHTLMAVVQENSSHFSKGSDPKAEEFLDRLKLALKHAGEHSTIYPPTAEEILAGSRSLPEDVRHWAEKKVLSGAMSAAFNCGFRLVTGAFSLPARVAFQGIKTGGVIYRGTRAVNRGVRLGQGPAGAQVKNKLVNQELSKAAIRLTLSLSPVTAWGAAASIIGERLYNEKGYLRNIVKNTVIDLPEELLWIGGYAGVGALIKEQTERTINCKIQEMLAEYKKASLHNNVPVETEIQTVEGKIKTQEEAALPSAQADFVPTDATGVMLQTVFDDSVFADDNEQEINLPRTRRKRSTGGYGIVPFINGEPPERKVVPLLNNYDSELSPDSKLKVSSTETSEFMDMGKTHQQESPDNRIMRGGLTSILTLASEAIKNEISQVKGEQIDPNKFRLIRFGTITWVNGELHQYDPIDADNHTLTEWVLRNFRREIRDDVGVDENLWGIYPIGHKGDVYKASESLKLKAKDFVKMVTDMDFYKKIYMPKLEKYWSDADNVKWEESRYNMIVRAAVQDKTLSEVGKKILLNGVGIDNDKKYSVSASLFNINGYRATDMLLFSDKNRKIIVLFMPRVVKAIEFESEDELRTWVVSECGNPSGKTEISRHFSLEMRNTGVFYDGIDEWLDYYSNPENKSENLEKIYSDQTVINSPVIKYITQEKRKRMISDADNIIKSDSEVTRDAWIEYMSAADKALPNAFTPFVGLGLSTERMIDADNDAELAEAKSEVIADSINIAIMILMSPEDEIEPSESNTSDVNENNVSKQSDLELPDEAVNIEREAQVSQSMKNEIETASKIYVDDGNEITTFHEIFQDTDLDDLANETWQYGPSTSTEIGFNKQIESNISVGKWNKYIFKKFMDKERVKSYSIEEGKFLNDDDFSIESVGKPTEKINSYISEDEIKESFNDMTRKIGLLRKQLRSYNGADKDDITGNLSALEGCIYNVNKSVEQIDDADILVHALVKRKPGGEGRVYGAVNIEYIAEGNKLALGSLYTHPYVIVNKYPGFRAKLLSEGVVSKDEMAEYNIKNVAKYLGYRAIKDNISVSKDAGVEIKNITFSAINPITQHLGMKYQEPLGYLKNNPFKKYKEQTPEMSGDSSAGQEVKISSVDESINNVQDTPVRQAFRDIKPEPILSEHEVKMKIEAILKSINGKVVAENLDDGINSPDNVVRKFAIEVKAAAEKANGKYQRANNLFNLAEKNSAIKSKLQIFINEAAGLNDDYPDSNNVSHNDISAMAYNRMKSAVASGYKYMSSQRDNSYNAFNLVEEKAKAPGNTYAYALPYDEKKRIFLVMKPKSSQSSDISYNIVHETTHVSANADDLSYLGDTRQHQGNFPSSLTEDTRSTENFFKNKRVANLTTNFVFDFPRNTLNTPEIQERAEIILRKNKLLKAEALLNTAEYQTYLIDILDNTKLNADSTDFEFTGSESISSSDSGSRVKRSEPRDENDLEKTIMLSVALMGSVNDNAPDTLRQALAAFINQGTVGGKIDPAYEQAFKSLPPAKDIGLEQVRALSEGQPTTDNDLLSQAKNLYVVLAYLSGSEGIKLPIDTNAIRAMINQDLKKAEYEYEWKKKEINEYRNQLKNIRLKAWQSELLSIIGVNEKGEGQYEENEAHLVSEIDKRNSLMDAWQHKINEAKGKLDLLDKMVVLEIL